MWRSVVVVALASCSHADDRTWNGAPTTCTRGTLVAAGLATSKPTDIVADGHCHVVIIASALDALQLTARDDASVEIRASRIGGELHALGRAQLAVLDTRPPPDRELVVLADTDARVSVTRSLLRGEHPVAGNGQGVITVIDSVLAGRDGETSIYTWGSARVQVRGGSLIGTAVALDGGRLDLRPTHWLAPADDRRHTLHALHCLATANVRLRAALAAQPPLLGVDDVRACADQIAADAHLDPRRQQPPHASDEAGAGWASQLLPFAGKAQQLRDYLAAGDDKDDAGKRGAKLRDELVQLARRLDDASHALASAVLVDREAARAWLSDKIYHRLQQRVIELVFAAEDTCIAFAAADRGGVPAALDRASEAATQLFDLLAAEPKIADNVDSFWAPESGNATTWGALEVALRTLRDEVKRVRRELVDRKLAPEIHAALGIAAALDQVESHYSRLRFGR